MPVVLLSEHSHSQTKVSTSLPCVWTCICWSVCLCAYMCTICVIPWWTFHHFSDFHQGCPSCFKLGFNTFPWRLFVLCEVEFSSCMTNKRIEGRRQKKGLDDRCKRKKNLWSTHKTDEMLEGGLRGNRKRNLQNIFLLAVSKKNDNVRKK